MFLLTDVICYSEHISFFQFLRVAVSTTSSMQRTDAIGLALS